MTSSFLKNSLTLVVNRVFHNPVIPECIGFALGAPKSVPKEILFLELGVLPLREIIMQRRLNFLHYILTQETNSTIFQVFQTQLKYRSKSDWVTKVKEHLK